MKRWNLIDQVETSSGSNVSLREHDGSYVIRVDGAELMSTRQYASEEKIAELACAHIGLKRGARVLIGGLGFGFTLRSALATLPADAKVIVAEVVPAVVAWNRNPAYPLASEPLKDSRVQIVERDVFDIITKDQLGFDAIILDVDNGPSALSLSDNKRLYQEVGLEIAKSRLRAGGCLAFWSASAAPLFEKTMRKAGFNVDVQKARARPTGGGIHTLYLGRTREHRHGLR